MELKLTYTEYKSHVLDSETKNLQYQHIITSTGGAKYYTLFAPDGEHLLYICYIDEVRHASSVIDYEANYTSNANNQIKDNVFRSDRFRREYDSTSGDVTHECTDDGWTEFYDIDFGSEKKWFSEFVYKCDNLEKIRVKIDDEVALQAPLNSLKKVIVDDDGITMKDIDFSYVNNISTLYLDLNYQKGSRIRILQQRRNGTGDLTAKGYVLSYVEKK